MMNVAPQHSAAVLQPLKLSGIIKGSFMPLTGDASPASSRNSVVMPMVGCHITVQGRGIQWRCHEVCMTAAIWPYAVLPCVTTIRVCVGNNTGQVVSLLPMCADV